MLLSIFNKQLRTSEDDTDNPRADIDIFGRVIPANANILSKMAQLMCLIAYVAFADESLQDILTAIECFPKFSRRAPGDKLPCMVLSSLLRLAQGLLAVSVVFVLIVTTSDVVEIILNFTAVSCIVDVPVESCHSIGLLTYVLAGAHPPSPNKVAYISDFDGKAFTCALEGKYGSKLKAEALRIKNLPAPACIVPPNQGPARRHLRNHVTMAFLACAMLSMFGVVNYAQYSPKLWLTSRLRVQIKVDGDTQQYSGCYDRTGTFDSVANPRYIYESHKGAKFGYCLDKRRWHLFRGDKTSVCEEKNLLAQSEKTLAFGTYSLVFVLRRNKSMCMHKHVVSLTFTFLDRTCNRTTRYRKDIATMFDKNWYSPSNIPLEVYFIEDEGLLKDSCDSFLGDGICNPEFNEQGYNWDEGDCCAATCRRANCGIGTKREAFGISVTSADGYPHCNDPVMTAITIKVNDVTREAKSEENNLPPQDPLLILDCGENKYENNYLTVTMTAKMINKTETLMVPDGAACIITIRNSTGPDTGFQTPNVNFVKYTVYHEDRNLKENPIVMFQGDSNKFATTNFQRIPTCFFTKLNKYTNLNLTTVYSSKSPSSKAIAWLMQDGKYSDCERESFLQRYALAAINFAAPNSDNKTLWISEERECVWTHATCVDGIITELNLPYFGLSGTIASEIGILANLTRLDVCKYCRQAIYGEHSNSV